MQYSWCQRIDPPQAIFLPFTQKPSFWVKWKATTSFTMFLFTRLRPTKFLCKYVFLFSKLSTNWEEEISLCPRDRCKSIVGWWSELALLILLSFIHGKPIQSIRDNSQCVMILQNKSTMRFVCRLFYVFAYFVDCCPLCGTGSNHLWGLESQSFTAERSDR